MSAPKPAAPTIPPDIGRRIREYRAQMRPIIAAVVRSHANAADDFLCAEDIMNALTENGFVCAGPVVEAANRQTDAALTLLRRLLTHLERCGVENVDTQEARAMLDAAGRLER